MKLSVGNEYDIDISTVSTAQVQRLRARNYAGWVVFVDTNTRRDCWPRVQHLLTHENLVLLEIEEGERNKHLASAQVLWEGMFRAGVGRTWLAICLGGGVLADMAGFVASTYKRGIDFLQIPTTLLSQVDSSVGGKLGVDFFDLKNSIGVFRNPIEVWIDAAFLRTLPAREIRSGYAEILKHALIADADQWAKLTQITDLATVDWSAVIPASVAIKRDVVLADPYERGLRKSLNFGHTIGHAVESYFLHSDQRLLHGEAIALGMICEAYLSHRQLSLSTAGLAEIKDYFLKIYGHQPIPPEAFPRLLELMRNDKKNDDARINFTLLEAIGRARVNETVGEEEITAALGWYNERGED